MEVVSLSQKDFQSKVLILLVTKTTLLHEIFATCLFRDSEVRIIRDP